MTPTRTPSNELAPEARDRLLDGLVPRLGAEPPAHAR